MRVRACPRSRTDRKAGARENRCTRGRETTGSRPRERTRTRASCVCVSHRDTVTRRECVYACVVGAKNTRVNATLVQVRTHGESICAIVYTHRAGDISVNDTTVIIRKYVCVEDTYAIHDGEFLCLTMCELTRQGAFSSAFYRFASLRRVCFKRVRISQSLRERDNTGWSDAQATVVQAGETKEGRCVGRGDRYGRVGTTFRSTIVLPATRADHTCIRRISSSTFGKRRLIAPDLQLFPLSLLTRETFNETGSYRTSPPHREKLRSNDPGENTAANDRPEIYFFNGYTYKYRVQTIFPLGAEFVGSFVTGCRREGGLVVWQRTKNVRHAGLTAAPLRTGRSARTGIGK